VGSCSPGGASAALTVRPRQNPAMERPAICEVVITADDPSDVPIMTGNLAYLDRVLAETTDERGDGDEG